MNQLNVRITGMENLGRAGILLDGKPVRCKKNEFGNYMIRRKDAPEKVRLQIVSYLDCGGLGWFIVQLVFFLVSIFGLFDVHKKPSYTVVDLDATIDTTSGKEVVIRCSRKTQSEIALLVEPAPNVSVQKNICHFNDRAKRTYRMLSLTKAAVAGGLVVAVIVCLALANI